MKLADQKNRLREIGSDGTGVFTDYSNEIAELNRPKQINDYRKMLDDGTVEALFNIVTMPILASEYTIEAEDDSVEAEIQAEFVRSNLLSENYKGGIETPFDLFLDQAMMALIDGFQVWEKVYRLKNGHYELKKLALRDSRSIIIVSDKQEGYQGIKQTQVDGSEVEIPAYKTFLFTHGKRYDALYGRSMFTALWKNYDKKQKLEYLDSIALQNDAIKPKLLKSTTDNLTKDPKPGILSKALHTLGRLGKVNSVASIPVGYEVEVLDSNGRDPHQSIERQNSEMARVFLANFMLLGTQGASSTGSFALSATQAKIFKMSLESILDKLASHINQYIIADLIDINFAIPHYPTFKFEKLDDDVISAVFNAFTTLAQKDRISDAMAGEIEDATAAKLGFDVEKIREKREASKSKTAENETEETSDKIINTSPRKNLSEQHNDEISGHMEQLNSKWQELERRFLEQIRPVYEAEAEKITKQIVEAKAISDISQIKFTAEYAKILRSYFKQGYQIGKVSVADELGKPAPKSSDGLGQAAAEYIDWIVEKQQNDLTEFARGYVIQNNIMLADDQNNKLSITKVMVLGWFMDKLLATSSYVISQSINSGRNSLWNDNDLIEFSAILDGRTSPGCAALDGKAMRWHEWKEWPELLPPRHFNCRSMMVKISDELENDVEGPDIENIWRLDYVTKTKKDTLLTPQAVANRVTKEEVKSLLYYQGSGYRVINNSLRTKDFDKIEPDIRKHIKRLDSVIKKNKTSGRMVVYRGFGSNEELKVNDILSNKAFMSTSYEKSVANNFANMSNKKYRYVMELDLPSEHPYADVQKILQEKSFFDEAEILTNRGQRVIIKDIMKSGDKTVLKAKLIDGNDNELSDKKTIGKTQAVWNGHKKHIIVDSEGTRGLMRRWAQDDEDGWFEIIRAKDVNNKK